MSKNKKPPLIDIVDQDNQPLGLKMSVDEANRKGYWHRSIHAVVRTADGQYLVEMRSPNIMIAPSMLDVTLGGYVDLDETPDKALLREVKKELGLDINPSQVSFLRIIKKSGYHPRFKRYTKGFNYCYLIQLLPDQHNYIIQKEEVSRLFLLSHARTRRLVRRHSLKGFGRLNYTYKFYKENLELAEALPTTVS